ncbi:MAG TPA: HAD-IA family hydrolase [Longimicrobiaceae bacterium]|nr:HAD-IA family hydrolase [Longimicrobiaceae bacterium]
MTDLDRPIRAVLYDFDGTLADTTELVLQCYRHTMGLHLGKVPPDEQWLCGFGRPLPEQLLRFARDETQRDAMLETYMRYQEERYAGSLRPFPRAVETVAELESQGVALAIVTSRHQRSTLLGLDLCGLTRHFGVIVTPADARRAKPFPDPVLVALERLGVAAAEAVFVGDSPHDMAAGRAAGTHTAAALWGPVPRADLEAQQPDFFLREPTDVLALVGAGAERRRGEPAA